MHRTPVMDERFDARCDLIGFSRLRWDHADQRPHQLLACAAADRRVFFFEPPIFEDEPAHLSLRRTPEGVVAITPTVPRGSPRSAVTATLRSLVDHLIRHQYLTRYALWFDTPTAVAFAHHLEPIGVAYDCLPDGVDEPGDAAVLESMLLAAADIVFLADPERTEATRVLHTNVHSFPSPDDPRAAPARPRSWDRTWHEMDLLLEEAIAARGIDDACLAQYASARPSAVAALTR